MTVSETRRESRGTAAENRRVHIGEQRNETNVEGHVVDSVDIKSGRDNELGNKAR